jgi:hypothetical protein
MRGASAIKKPRYHLFVLDKTQCTWRAHYWLWEANRQVLLYPENDLDPNLRMRKTPVFAQMKDALLQGEIDGDKVTQADLAFVPPYQNLNAVLTHTEYTMRDGQKVAAVGGSRFHGRSRIAACSSWIFGVPIPSRSRAQAPSRNGGWICHPTPKVRSWNA